MGTWIVGVIVFCAVGFAAYKIYKDRKNGKNCGSCPGCCAGCRSHSADHHEI